MNEMVLVAFADEMRKIAANVVAPDIAGVKPAPIPSLQKSTNSATKPQTKATTNYATVTTQGPGAAAGAASGSAPPPPVRT